MHYSIARRRSLACAPLFALLCGLASAAPASAGTPWQCGGDSVFDFSGQQPFPFDGESIGVGTTNMRIVGTTFHVVFTATGTFSAADISFALTFIPLYADGGGISAGIGVNGGKLGWSGQGTFTADFETDALNGYLTTDGQPWYTFLFNTINENPGAGPATGVFDELTYTLHLATCPVGDLSGDYIVNGLDLADLLAQWGRCPDCIVAPCPCPADLDHNTFVNGLDIAALLANWGDHAPCPLCK